MYRFLLIMLFCLSTQAADYSHLKEIEKAKGNLIYGEAVTAKDLKGKVILFEYWGTWHFVGVHFFLFLQE